LVERERVLFEYWTKTSRKDILMFTDVYTQELIRTIWAERCHEMKAREDSKKSCRSSSFIAKTGDGGSGG
jgi:hypothetical protein